MPASTGACSMKPVPVPEPAPASVSECLSECLATTHPRQHYLRCLRCLHCLVLLLLLFLPLTPSLLFFSPTFPSLSLPLPKHQVLAPCIPKTHRHRNVGGFAAGEGAWYNINQQVYEARYKVILGTSWCQNLVVYIPPSP